LKTWIIIASVIFLAFPVCHSTPHFDATGRIGVLCIGDTSYGESPILGWLSLDFAVQWQELPTDVGGVMTDEDAKKVTRIYTPRTLERLLQNYDLLLLLEPRMQWFGGREMKRFRDSVEAGVSTLLTLWPDDEGYLSLVNSDLADVYPHQFSPTFQPHDGLPYVVRVKEGNPPVLTPFLEVGVEKYTGKNARPMNPRQGSTIWAIATKTAPLGREEDEFIISWEYGPEEARNWVIGVDVDEQWFNLRAGNDYGGDIVLNMLYHSAGKRLPPNIQLIHGLRSSFYRYSLEKKLVFAIIEFVDKFGANTASLEELIEEADGGKSTADSLYLEGDYEGSYSKIKEMIASISELNQKAIEIKERALLWVYITEWSVVSGTLTVGGFVLYSLMVRRRLYREVSVTRAR